MPIQVFERHPSRRTTEGENPSVELQFVITGTDDDIVAKSALDAATPIYYDGLVKQSLSIEPQGEDWWYGDVQYGKRKSPELSESSYSFDTTGGTTKVTQAIATIGSYAPSGKSAPNFKGAIGWDGKTVQGCDVTIPTYKWTETHYQSLAFIDSAYRLGLASMTGTTNLLPFRDFAALEVLFLGAVGSQRGWDEWEIQYHFAASPNMASLSVGDITGIVKAGWDYLWVLYEETDDANKLISVPRAAYVEQVYRRTEFDKLGIGVQPL